VFILQKGFGSSGKLKWTCRHSRRSLHCQLSLWTAI